MGVGFGYDWGSNFGGGWQVTENRPLQKKLAKSKSGLPRSVVEKYDVWKAIVRNEGIQKIKEDNSYHHEHLKGRHKGLCSSRLTKKYRVVYEMNEPARKIYVKDVGTHDRVY